MGWWSRLFGGGRQRGTSAAPGRTDGPEMAIDLGAVREHAADFVRTRRGVEGYVEPATHVTTTTLVLIAHDGEWTRRAVGSPQAAVRLCRQLEIPVYDVNQIGYPSRMREWSRRQRGR